MNNSKINSAICETLENRQFFNVAGPLDNSFGGGLVTTSFGGTAESAIAALPLKDGRVLAAGVSQTGASETAVFAMYKANGTLDSSFDGDGKLTLTSSAFPQQQGGIVVVNQIYQQPSGSILLSTNYGLFRMNLSGKLDTTFGTNGKINEPSAQIVVNADGSFRTYTPNVNTFSTNAYDANGKLVTAGPQGVSGRPIVLPDGRVVAVNVNQRLTFYTADLKKITALGNFGDTFLQTQFTHFLQDGKPWTDPRGTPMSGVPAVGFVSISTTRDGGYLIAGTVAGTSAKYNFSSSGGVAYTPITVKLDAKGNFVAINPVNSAGDGRTSVDYTGNFLQFDGNLAFGIGEGVNIGIIGKAGGAGAIQAADGSYYLAGETNPSGSNNGVFTVAHTVPVVASVTGTVFNDANSNGVKDSGEAVEGGRTVYIDANINGVLDANEYSTTTDANGKYTFANIGPNTYRIVVVPVSSETETTPTQIKVTVGQNATFNIGTHSTSPAKGIITGVLFNDDNFDQALDNGETVNASRVVYIDANHNNKLDSGEVQTMTDGTGHYTFNLAPGSYDIKRVLPSNDYRITTSTAPVSLAAGQTAVFNIGSTNKPGGPVNTGNITGVLFNDDNLNGTKDSFEAINAGRTVFIDANQNGKFDAGEQTTTTDSTGRYTFSNVPVGSYAIGRILPSGYQITNGLTFPNGREPYIGVDAGQTTEANIGSTALAIVEGITHYTGGPSGPDDPSAISGVRVFVDLNKNGKFDNGEPSVLSGQFARDDFQLGLAAGTYRITTDDPALKPNGLATSYIDVTLGAGTTKDINFAKPYVAPANA